MTAETPDPEGGKFYREDGELTGLVAERANYVISRLIPSVHTDEDRQAGVKLITELMAKAGLTSFHDAGHLVEQPACLPGGLPGGRIVNSGLHDVTWTLQQPARGGRFDRFR